MGFIRVLFSSPKRIAQTLVVFLAILAVPITLTLVQQQQDLRQRASEAIPVTPGGYDADGNIKPGPPGYDAIFDPTQGGWVYVPISNNDSGTIPPTDSGQQIPFDCGGQNGCMCYSDDECASRYCKKTTQDAPNQLSPGTCDARPDNTSKPLVCAHYGDINEDNVISEADTTMLGSALSGSTTLTLAQKSNSDLNNDGNITSQDYDMLKSYLGGSITTFPICSNHPVCTNPNSFNTTVLGCEQCLACGSLTWCENSQSGTDRLSRCTSSTTQCQSLGGIPKTSCPTQITDNPVCESLIADIASGPPPLKVKFTVIAKNEFGGISNIKIEGGDTTSNSVYASGHDWSGHTKTYSYDLTYATPGTYTARATVYGTDDAKSATSVACTKTITVGSVPTQTPTPTRTPATCATCVGTDKPFLCLGGGAAAYCNATLTSEDIVCTQCSSSPTPTPSSTPTASLPPTNTSLVCDNDKDNDIDTNDYNVWLTEFRSGNGSTSDCDGTSGVSIFDYAKWLGEYRKYVTATNP